jgi:hypothetical protein
MLGFVMDMECVLCEKRTEFLCKNVVLKRVMYMELCIYWIITAIRQSQTLRSNGLDVRTLGFDSHFGARMCSSFFSVRAVWRSKSSCDPQMKGLTVSKFSSKLD